jgi:hypothetical protein
MIRITIENFGNEGDEKSAELLGTLKIEQADSKRSPDWTDFTYEIDGNPDKSGSINNQFKANSIWRLLWKILDQEFNEL